MSAHPSATIGHAGRHACPVVRISVRVFAAECDQIVSTWCRLLGLSFGSETRGLDQIRKVVAMAPSNLLDRLPAIAPVVPPVKSETRHRLSDDPVIAVSVLCRCSEKVFIRDKSPIVTPAHLRRDIALVLPMIDEEPAP